ncbi:MAG: hypothetical protein F6K63_16165 [Moorea sp. SIO1G6]|uniref:Uncharacterized protein n=1 Tax=Moorena producens (strain JHB) TaxID=1454205 RepID=A0A1D9G8T2_MOOP1|nr:MULTISPECIES: hypothetical protein [Moorena]AOY83885.1 hypothetical protein BJP36_32155 [Moorena producens JHB]NET65844.1 hypothetical protein [Moorena sp. SIO1G6]
MVGYCGLIHALWNREQGIGKQRGVWGDGQMGRWADGEMGSQMSDWRGNSQDRTGSRSSGKPPLADCIR